jgi:predicted kinase
MKPQSSPLLIAMAGLPGSGKSALARRMAEILPAVVLDKDALRSALFPPHEIEYSKRQDDLCFDLLLQAASYLTDKGRIVILDGRTFTRHYQVKRLLHFAQAAGVKLAIIECVSPEETIRQRLNRDAAIGTHPALNRSFEMYKELKAQAEPIETAHLVVNTDGKLEDCIATCVEYLRDL